MSRPLIRPARKARACANCRHFARTGTADVHRSVGGIYRTVGEQVRGECRARPPIRDRRTGAAAWPDVVASDWCSGFTKSERAT